MRYGLMIILLFGLVFSSLGQETNTFLQLTSATTNLETGQRYLVNIEVRDVQELWGADIRITYNPEQIYIVGTASGSPLRLGEFLQGGDTIFNNVNPTEGEIRYAFSIFSPANPVSGTGIIGSFEIVPLLAGTSQIQFSAAELSSVEFILDASGQRIGGDAIELSFLPVLLELQITGDPATPPSEASATPTLTATIDPALLGQDFTQEAEATLVNITAAPNETSPETNQDESISSSPILFIGIAMVILASLVLLILFVLRRS